MELSKQEAIKFLAQIETGKQLAQDARVQLVDLIRDLGPQYTNEVGHKLQDQMMALRAQRALGAQQFDLEFTYVLAEWALRVLSIEAFEPELREAAR